MAAILWIVEGQVASGPFTAAPGWSWRSARETVGREARRCEILVFGDSQMKVGLHPRWIEDRLDLRAYNLAVARGQPPSSYYLLEDAVARGGPLRAVVLSCVPEMLGDPPAINGAEFGELLSLRQLIDLTLRSRDVLLTARAIGHRCVPSVQARGEIRAALVEFVSGGAWAPPRLVRERRERDAQRGAVDRAGTLTEAAAGPFGIGPVRMARNRPNRTNLAYVHRFLALARRHGLPVFWLTPTYSPATWAQRERRGGKALYFEMLRSLQDEFPNMIVLDTTTLPLTADAFSDPLHLNSQGAVTLSRAVAEAIATRTPNGRRWVALREAGPVPQLARGGAARNSDRRP